MKNGVFKLNWVEQRSLEFEVHEVHSEKKKKEQLQAAVDRPPIAVDSRYSEMQTESKSLSVCRQQTFSCRHTLGATDSRALAVDRPTNRDFAWISLSTGLLRLSVGECSRQFSS